MSTNTSCGEEFLGALLGPVFARFDEFPMSDLAALLQKHEKAVSVTDSAIEAYRNKFPPPEEVPIIPSTLDTDVLAGTAVRENQFVERSTTLELPGFDALTLKLVLPEHVAPNSPVGELVIALKSFLTSAKEALQRTKYVRDDEQSDGILRNLTRVADVVVLLATVPELDATLTKVHQATVVPIQKRYADAKTASETIDPLEKQEEWSEADKNLLLRWNEAVQDRSELDAIHKNAGDNACFEMKGPSVDEMLIATSAEIRSLEVELSMDSEDLKCVEQGCSKVESELEETLNKLKARQMFLMQKREKGERDAKIIEAIIHELLERNRCQIAQNISDSRELAFIEKQITPETGTLHLEKAGKLAVAQTRKNQLLTRNGDCNARIESWKCVEKAINLLYICKENINSRGSEYFLAHGTELNYIRDQIIALLRELTVRQADCNYQLSRLKAGVEAEKHRQTQLIKTRQKPTERDKEALVAQKEEVRTLEELRDELTVQIESLKDEHAKCMLDALRGEQHQFCHDVDPKEIANAKAASSFEVHTKTGVVVWQPASQVLETISAERSLKLIEEEIARDRAIIEEKKKEQQRLEAFLRNQADYHPVLAITSSASTTTTSSTSTSAVGSGLD
ncbi:hypothetical protein Pelo_3964 [Pelomyxa schiedti]|nr:hypothetical protein Pelo_3964 [Pelomyxa schiedti]